MKVWKICIDTVYRVAKKKEMPRVTDFCEKGDVHRCIHAVCHQVEDHAQNNGMSPRFAAVKIIENDTDIIKRLELSQNELDMMEHSIEEMETDHHMDRNAALADMRYTFIEKVCAKTVTKCQESREHKRSVKIDRVLTDKYLAIPMFLGIMLLIFWLTFGLIGQGLSDLLSIGIDRVTALADHALTVYGMNPVVSQSGHRRCVRRGRKRTQFPADHRGVVLFPVDLEKIRDTWQESRL